MQGLTVITVKTLSSPPSLLSPSLTAPPIFKHGFEMCVVFKHVCSVVAAVQEGRFSRMKEEKTARRKEKKNIEKDDRKT